MNATKRTLNVSLGLCLLLNALPAPAQTVSQWRKLDIGQSIWHDDLRLDGWDKEEERLASDGAGRLYFANGASLLIGTQGGAQWKTVTRDAPSARLVAAAGKGLVAWHNLQSLDGGETWKKATEFPDSHYGRWGVHAGGNFFFGGLSDAIRVVKPPYTSWTSGFAIDPRANFGNIYQFATSESGNVAAMGYATVYLSSDSGSSWIDWVPLSRENTLIKGTVRSISLEPRSGSVLWLSAERTANDMRSLWRMDMNTREVENLFPTAFPDSLVNVIRVSRDGSLWLGTWGQGVWVSRDGAKTFAPHNGSLGNLFIKGLEETSDGFMFALTPGGLYRYEGPGAGLASPARAGRVWSGSALVFPGLRGALKPHGPGGGLVRADGRKVFMD